MKKPYRDKFGRFTKRQTPKKRKKHVKPSRKVVEPIVRKIRTYPSRKIAQRKKITTKKEKETRQKRLPEKKPLPVRKPKRIVEWDEDTVGDILDVYIDNFDLDEDMIGDYRDPLQHLYEYLRSFTYRHSETFVVSKTKMIPWKSKPWGVQIWFLVYYHHRGEYNIEFRTWENEDRVTLRQLVESIHSEFISIQNQIFQRERTFTYKHSEAQHLIALLPVMAAPPKKNVPYFHKHMREDQGGTRTPTIYRFNPPPKRVK